MGGKHSTRGNKTRILGFGRRNLKERKSLEDPGIDGKIIFKRSLNDNGKPRNRFTWLRIGAYCGLL